jgi:hypothetical protein
MAGARPVLEEVGNGVRNDVAAVRAIDATLGIPGRPQSGTGQTALLTGRNAPELLGRHFGPWVPTGLRELLFAENLFQRSLSSGKDVAFANAYPRAFHAHDSGWDRRPGAFPLAARAAGVLTRDEADVREGNALVSSIQTRGWRRYVDPDAPDLSPGEAGRRLARISSLHDLTVFAHFDTDHVGHHGDLPSAIAALHLVDAFFEGLLGDLDPDTLLVTTSDHGNLEDLTDGHTLNPVPLICVGRGSGSMITRVNRLCDVAGVILEMLDDRKELPAAKGRELV